MGDLFSDLLSAYVQVETVKAETNLDAYQQGLNQAAAIKNPELHSQQSEVKDATDLQYHPEPMINGVDNRLLMGGAALVAVILLVKVIK